MPTQGDGIPLRQGASTVIHQKDSVLSASVSSLELGGSLSGMSLGKSTLKKDSVPSKCRKIPLYIIFVLETSLVCCSF